MMFGTTGGIIEPFKSRRSGISLSQSGCGPPPGISPGIGVLPKATIPPTTVMVPTPGARLDCVPRRLCGADDHSVNLDIFQGGSGRRKSARRNRCNNRVRAMPTSSGISGAAAAAGIRGRFVLDGCHFRCYRMVFVVDRSVGATAIALLFVGSSIRRAHHCVIRGEWSLLVVVGGRRRRVGRRCRIITVAAALRSSPAAAALQPPHAASLALSHCARLHHRRHLHCRHR